jgi:FdhD protein
MTADRIGPSPREERLRLRPIADLPDRAVQVQVRRYANGFLSDTSDEVAVEEPLELRVAGQSVAVIMRTPGQDAYLAVGFFLSEGIIRAPGDVCSIELGADRDGFPLANVLELRLRSELEAADQIRGRAFSVSAACGLCGTASIAAIRSDFPPVNAEGTTTPAILLDLEDRLRTAQAVFQRTGGLHAAGLFDLQGQLITMHEDVGRHNAVDKVVGEQFLAGRVPLGDSILLASGRASFELLQKSAIAGVSIFAAVGAPSSLAIELAEAAGITLIGLLRSNRFVVYTYPERVERPGGPV